MKRSSELFPILEEIFRVNGSSVAAQKAVTWRVHKANLAPFRAGDYGRSAGT